ncbi:MAG: hypothetical protein ACKVX7_00880 [Planctomycetota bacterium]
MRNTPISLLVLLLLAVSMRLNAQSIFGGFVSVQVNVDAAGMNTIGDAANEPSIAVDPTNPLRVAIGWRQFDTVASNFRQAGWGYSIDGGLAWTFPGVIEPGVFRSDPVLEADANGVIYYHSLTTAGGGYSCDLFRSFDGGATWDTGVDAYGGDKAWIAIDRTGGPGHGNIYAAWDYAGCCGDNWFNRSTDGGATFEPPVPIPEQPVWGVVAVGPDGEVYIAGRRSPVYDEFVVAKSTTIADPGAALAFDFATVVDLGGALVYGGGPNPGGLLGQVWIDVDHSSGPTRGYVYVLCSVNPPGSDPLDVHLVRSTNGGVSFEPPVRINDDPLGSNDWQWFGTLAVAPNGRLDVIWNDTRANPGGFWSQLYYSSSLDAGLSWSPNQALSIAFDPHLGWPQQQKLGDYYDMVSDLVGVDVAYAATFNGEQDVYYLRIGDTDCNQNGTGDAQDILSGASPDINLNGIPDECESSLPFQRGDCNGDDGINIADPITLLAYLFGALPLLDCSDSCDGNDDGALDISDAIAQLTALFALRGPLPPPTDCGADPTPDTLACTSSVCP